MPRMTSQEKLSERLMENVDHYSIVNTSVANNRSFLDLEQNISVRDEFTADDYYRFRPGEDPAGSHKYVISKSHQAYKKIGIVKNIIDLMGDFASRGITLNHTNKRVERFCRKWWRKVHGPERSERFLNNLYRAGNVIVYRINGTITKRDSKNMAKAAKSIPSRYIFLNPLSVEVDGDYADLFAGNIKYKMRMSRLVKQSYSNKSRDMTDLPDTIRDAIVNNKDYIPLPPEDIAIHFYKKDDWDIWACPMIEPILDDLSMLEKMKLADLAALDGAISNIRLWNLGSLEHKIVPNKAALDKLRNILASHVGGGTIDLVWGPELTFKESATEVYKFLGNEKYGPVLNGIYGGLGIPQSLTGSTSSTGFTNNFVSLKTLIERLEYGRGILEDFWNNELAILSRVMSFDPPTLHFETIVLSDEAAEKKLLIDLADRNLISDETLRERLGEDNRIEDSRVKKQFSRYKKKNWPPKAGQFHNGNLHSDYVKMGLESGQIDLENVVEYEVKEVPATPEAGDKPDIKKKNSGRPPFSKDQDPRKKRRVLPRSKAEISDLIVWATESQKKIADILNPILLSYYQKKNLRELSRKQLEEMETAKFKALANIAPFTEIQPENVLLAMDNSEILDASEYIDSFVQSNGRSPNIDELRNIYCVCYALSIPEKK